MAEATNENSKELSGGTTNGLVGKSPCEAAMACSLPFGPDEPVHAGHETDGLSAVMANNVSVTLDRDGFLTSLVGRLAAFHDWLPGPPLSKQDRVNAQVMRARNELYWPS